MPFAKVLLASGLREPYLEYSNVHNVFSLESHSKLNASIENAERIVLVGSSIELYELATEIRAYLSLKDKFPKIFILDESDSEFESLFGPLFSNFLLDKFKQSKINIIRKAKILDIQELNGELRLIKF